jgi:uncharacterized protein YndB with AHSA1/START domain
MPTENDASAWIESNQRSVARTGDTHRAVVRCRFDVSIKEVWAGCTDRDLLRRWFADVGGTMIEGATLTFDVGAPCKVTSRILRCEPPHGLLLTWSYPGRATDEVEFRLSTDGDGAVVELEHRSADKTDWWVGAGAGWELALIRLGLLLCGDDPATVSAEELDRKLGPLWMEAGRSSRGREE